MELKFDKEMAKSIGEKSWRLTKKIAIKGVQAMVIETATKTLNASFEGDMTKVKEQLTFDGIVGPKPEKKPRKKLFSRKKDETEELLEDIEEVIEAEVEEVKLDDVEVEVIDKKKKK